MLAAEVRVSFETHSARLHAKAWLFEREGGFPTGLVGSSNPSHAALVNGLEWNVRLGALENAGLIGRFRATFAEYLADRTLEALTPGKDDDRLRAGLHGQRALGRHGNLVVAATGRGKTWVAAFDYAAATNRAGPPPRRLFVAHRREILEQSRAVFRIVLQDRQFGALLVDGEVPLRWDHVFPSVQSLSPDRLSQLPALFSRVKVAAGQSGAGLPGYPLPSPSSPSSSPSSPQPRSPVVGR